MSREDLRPPLAEPTICMDEAYRRLISGESHSFGATIARAGLHLFSQIYGCGVRARNAAFENRWRAVHRASVPVVSLGNLTTGGTGKTPFAAFVARFYSDRGVRVAFVSRGYGSDGEALNDEALVLRQLCPGVPHVQGPDRVRGAARAVTDFGAQLVILDDGFQHRRLARDLDIVLVDATNPWGYGHLLPRGLLREPRRALKRADLIVLTRVDQVGPESLESLRGEVAAIALNRPIAESTFPPDRLLSFAGVEQPLESLKGLRIAAFCGIGNPRAFRASLEQQGCTVTGFHAFPDHHRYSSADLDELSGWIGEVAPDAVLCTQKDLVKIHVESLADRPLRALAIGTCLTRGVEVVTTCLGKAQSLSRE